MVGWTVRWLCGPVNDQTTKKAEKQVNNQYAENGTVSAETNIRETKGMNLRGK